MATTKTTEDTLQSIYAKAQALADEANVAGIRPPADDRSGRVYTADDMKKLHKAGQGRTL